MCRVRHNWIWCRLQCAGSGTIGSGVVFNFLRRGAKVIAPVRSEASVTKLKKQIGGDFAGLLQVSITDVSDQVAAKDLADVVSQEHGAIDYVVCCIGGTPSVSGAASCRC
jgi:NAD(P)-dependent dehydrogenase (short-subunit alcohol dehydrogenase family)